MSATEMRATVATRSTQADRAAGVARRVAERSVPFVDEDAVRPSGIAEAGGHIGRAISHQRLVQLKGSESISVCIPARDESATIVPVVALAVELRRARLFDEVLVIDDHSRDDTAQCARAAGATVIANTFEPGKGGALRSAALATTGSLLLFLDADVTSYTRGQLVDLTAPLIHRPEIQLVKGAYHRGCDGHPDEGGRVTELLARPLLERLHPKLAHIRQPLAGETAIRRRALDRITLADGYGIEIGLLIDVARVFGAGSITQVDLGERVHRNRPLSDLRRHSREVLAAALERSTLQLTARN